MGYNSADSFSHNRLDSSSAFAFSGSDVKTDFFRPGSLSPLYTSIQFYSPLFLQRLTGNKWSFLSLAGKGVRSREMEEIVSDEESETVQNLTTDSSILPPESDIIEIETTTITQFLENVFNNATEQNTTDLESDSSEVVSFTTILNNTTTFNETQGFSSYFGGFDLPEYAVFGGVLLLSAVIGVFFGCFGKGQKSTTANYLIANRQMSTIPAALSLLCRFVGLSKV